MTTEGSLLDRGLADPRLAADDWTQARLLSSRAHHIQARDSAAGIAAYELAVTRFEATGRPSGEQAYSLFWLAQHRLQEGTATVVLRGLA